MSTVWTNHAINVMTMVNNHKEEQAQNYLKQLLHLPTDSQDKIIEEISHLNHCHCDAVVEIINAYSTNNNR